jgi:DNA-binding IclR family transcriptional regulator
VGEVLSIDRAERKPLAFGNGQYLTIDSYDLADNARSLGRKQDQLAAMRLGARAIERLARKFDQTMALAVWGSHGPTIVQWEPSAAPVSDDLPLGLTLPVTSTATGLAFAAHLPSAAIAETLWRDQAASEESDWETRLWEVRRLGLARQELETFYRTETLINALSAPVLDASGQAVLALTAVGEAKISTQTSPTPCGKPRMICQVASVIATARAHRGGSWSLRQELKRWPNYHAPMPNSSSKTCPGCLKSLSTRRSMSAGRA